MGKRKDSKDIPKYANRTGWTQPVYACPTCGARLISPDTCIECGQRIQYKDMQVDHVKSVFANTDISHTMTEEEMYSEKNLLPACRQCNFYKSSGNLESFREALTNTLMRNLQETFQYRLAIKYGLIQEHIEPVQFYFEKIGINIDVSDCGLLGWGKN